MIGEYEAREIAAKWAFPSDECAMKALAERGEIRNEADLVGKGYWGGGETTLEAVDTALVVADEHDGEERDDTLVAELTELRAYVVAQGAR